MLGAQQLDKTQPFQCLILSSHLVKSASEQPCLFAWFTFALLLVFSTTPHTHTCTLTLGGNVQRHVVLVLFGPIQGVVEC